MIFPKLFTRILARDPLQYLRTTGMLIDEFSHVVDAIVDYDVHSFVGTVFCGDVGGVNVLDIVVSFEKGVRGGLWEEEVCGWLRGVG